MKLSLLTTTTTSTTATLTPRTPPLPFLRLPTPHPNHYSLSFPKTHHPSRPTSLLPLFSSNPAKQSNPTNGFSSSSNLELGGMSNDSLGVVGGQEGELEGNFSVQVGNPVSPSFLQSKTAKLSLSDQAFFLLAFIACTTSVAFTSLVVAAVPTLYAMGRAATSLSKLADTACEELPSTMAAIRLSGMEISDLTLELSDLSQEITEGVNKSAQAVQAAEAGIRQMGALARHHTISMIQERASLPIVSLQPVVAGAAKKTSRAVGQATKSLINMISGGELSSEDNNDNGIDGVDI